MKLRWIMPILTVAWICLTGCGDRRDMTVQQDEMPVVPAETTYVRQTDTSSVAGTSTAASVQTDAGSGRTTQTVTGTAEAAAADSTDGGSSGDSGSGRTANSLYGKPFPLPGIRAAVFLMIFPIPFTEATMSGWI